jgi:hypothetical protein
MQLPVSTIHKMHASAAARTRLRWGQLSLRSLLALVTLAGVLSFFHEPIGAWAKDTWQRWFADSATPVPPVVKPDPCPGCGMG